MLRGWKLFDSWRGEKPAFARAYRQMFMHLVRWLGSSFEEALVADVVGFLATPDRSPTFAGYLNGLNGDPGNGDAAGKFVTYMTHASAFSDFIAKELASTGKGRAIFPLVSRREIEQARNAEKRQGRAGRPHESTSRPLPQRLCAMTRAILEEGESGWPGRISACQEEIVAQDGSKTRIYCPVLPTLFLSLFDLPLRVGQMKRFDSGEGDLTRFDGSRLVWETNQGPAAGYWDARRLPANRGYAHRFDGTPPFTGFFVNTNKTGQPYLIPWENEAVHRRLHELRLWQETHNPVDRPIPPSLYVDDIEDADEGKLEDYPEIFSLFRLQTARRSGRQGAPPNIRKTGEFWQLLMAELERRLALESKGGPSPKLVKRQEKTGQAYAAKYNPHGLPRRGPDHDAGQKDPHRDHQQADRRAQIHPDDPLLHEVRTGAGERTALRSQTDRGSSWYLGFHAGVPGGIPRGGPLTGSGDASGRSGSGDGDGRDGQNVLGRHLHRVLPLGWYQVP